MFTLLLILHLIAVCCWLGGALYERFFTVGGVLKAKGTELEATMLKLMLSTVPFFLTSVFTILVTGIIMTIMHHYTFLSWSWIGLKQYIMLIVLLGFFFYIGPRMNKIGKQLNSNLAEGKGVNDEIRSQFNHIIILFDIMHIGVLINLILALTKFF
ncbi:hypothetical protein KHA93_21320 [Bacillus sp. FJAT-49732]|uniref:Copper resistance protein D domain-containing protein n=1 Tax=Lederbergia citrisecunda TaxID=2833583 RepID=A0A942TRE0_9BACI|nr:hypothetical protein [Lederbergia citrisecunda]MBS4202153.1 hypothetical protein [Lederbergia citrisecunda]